MINLDAMNDVIKELSVLSNNMLSASESLSKIEKNRVELVKITDELKHQNEENTKTQHSLEVFLSENRIANKNFESTLGNINNELQTSLKELLQIQTRSYNDYMMALGQKTDQINEQIKVLSNSFNQEFVNCNGKLDLLFMRMSTIGKFQKVIVGLGVATTIIAILGLFL